MRTNLTSSPESHSVDLDPAASPRAVRHTRAARRGLAGVASAALVGLLGVGALAGAVAGASTDGSSGAKRHPTTSTVAASDSRSTDLGTATTTATGTDSGRADAPEAQPEPQPQAQPEPEPASPGILAISTNHIDLPDNVYEGSFEVRNDGGSPVDWNWLMGDYGISVSQSGGTLAAGESVTVYFTINPFQLPEGDFLFANCVYNDDVAKDLHITGHRPKFVVNPDIPKPGLGLATAS